MQHLDKARLPPPPPHFRSLPQPDPDAQGGADVFLGLVVERLEQAIRPDTSQGEAPEVPMYERNRPPGSTGEVDRWTSKEPVDVVRSHVNAVVPDTMKWEQSASYYIDSHPLTDAFLKNSGPEFAIPYFHNGQPHDYMPDFIVRLKTDP